jgi:hypothetical protein
MVYVPPDGGHLDFDLNQPDPVFLNTTLSTLSLSLGAIEPFLIRRAVALPTSKVTKQSRKLLLPPYLEDQDSWQDLVDAIDVVWDLPRPVDYFLSLPGVVGSFVSTPAVRIVSDIIIKAKVSTAWVNNVGDQTIISQSALVDQLGWAFCILASGQLALLWSTDGTTTQIVNSTQVLPFTPNQIGYVKVRLVIDDGHGNHSVLFSISYDGETWTQLENPSVIKGVTSIYPSISDIEIGSTNLGSNSLFLGSIYQVNVSNTDESILDFQTYKYIAGTSEAQMDTGEEWVLRGLATVSTSDTRSGIDTAKTFIRYLRETYLIPDATDTEKIQTYQLLNQVDFDSWEREILIKQTNMIGFSFKETDLLSDLNYALVGRNLAHYWYSKGTPDMVNFLSFILDTVLTIDKLWSYAATPETYAPFLVEGDPGIGIPVYQSYLDLNGSSGNYASTLDSVTTSITGNIQIDALILPQALTGSVQTIVSKWVSSGNQRSFALYIDTNGYLNFTHSNDGVANFLVTSSSTLPTSGNLPYWVRLTKLMNDGSGNTVTNFSVSTDDINYVSLSIPRVVSGISSVYDSSTAIEIGSQEVGTTNLFVGKILQVRLYKEINGSPSVNFSANKFLGDGLANTGSMDTGEQWTKHGSSNIASGKWFPTTHVQISWDLFPKVDITDMQIVTKLTALFNSIANYNLVVESIALKGDLSIHSGESPDKAIVVAYPSFDEQMIINQGTLPPGYSGYLS